MRNWSAATGMSSVCGSLTPATTNFITACLETASGIKIGITPATEVRVVEGGRSKNTVLLQLEVDDLHELLAHLRQADSVITVDPSRDKQHGFWFGGFADPEGNPIWAVDKTCPCRTVTAQFSLNAPLCRPAPSRPRGKRRFFSAVPLALLHVLDTAACGIDNEVTTCGYAQRHPSLSRQVLSESPP